VTALRARISWIACAWLCCQLSVLAAAPFSLLQHSAAADPIACTCVHTGNAQCPMHHPVPQKRGCECRNTTDPDAATVVSLLGPIAVLAGPASSLTPPAVAESPAHHVAKFVGFIAILDGPPPRA